MAEPVSSFFLDGGLLGMVPREQAEQAASAANKAFMFGLLSGDIGAAYRNAQQSGYGVIDNAIKFQQHQLSLSEASRKAAETKLRQGAQQSALELVPGTGVGSGSFTDPNVELGPGGYGPGYIRPQTTFNERRYAETLASKGIATPEELKFAIPNIEFVNGVAVDKRNTKPGTFIPNMPVGLDPNGNPVGNVVQGVAAIEAAKEGAKSEYQFFDINNADGSVRKVSAAEAKRIKDGGGQVVSAFVPKLPEGVIPMRGKDGRVMTDPNGNILYGNAPGTVKAAGQTAGAKAGAEEAAKAQYDLVEATTSDGSKVFLTREQVRQMATKPGAGGQVIPATSQQSPQAKAESEAKGTFNIKEVLAPAKMAADAASKSNVNLSLLSTTLENTPLNQITATDTVQKLAGYAKASGILSAQAAAGVTNLSTLRGLVAGSVLQEQLAQKGPQVEADAKRMEQTIQGQGDKDATRFLITTKMAQNKRTQEYYAFIDKYSRDKGTIDGADEAWSQGKGKESIFRSPEMRKYAEQRKGKDGKMYYFFGDGGEAIPVPQKGK